MAAKFPEFDILALALAPLDLPMQDLDDQEDFALSKKENEERFGAPVRDNDLARAIEERIPDKTKKTTQWAYSVWQSWCEVRTSNHDSNYAILLLYFRCICSEFIHHMTILMGVVSIN